MTVSISLGTILLLGVGVYFSFNDEPALAVSLIAVSLLCLLLDAIKSIRNAKGWK